MARYGGKGSTPDSEWELLADRTNKYINLNNVKSEEDYLEKLEQVFLNKPRPDGKIPSWFPKDNLSDIARNNKDLKKHLEESIEDLTQLQIAQRYHARRRKNVRIADERKTAKNTSRATRGAVSRWKRMKGRGSDIRGVDTRLARRRLGDNVINSRDLSLKNYLVTLDVNGIKRYRDLSGKYARDPFRKRR